MGPHPRTSLVGSVAALLVVGSACPTHSECPGDADCAPPACAVCRDEKCSGVLSWCVDEPDCLCLSDCLGREDIPGVEGSLAGCGLEERPASFAALEECVAVACPDSEDECSTPAGYSFPDGTVLETTDEIGDGALADCGFDDALAFDPLGAVVQLQSVDRTVCVRLTREDLGPAEQANTSWALRSFHAGPLGRVSEVSDEAALCWYSSHHNFADWAHAWTGTRHYDLKLEESGHGGERSYELHSSRAGPLDVDACAPVADGTDPIGEPLKLFPYRP